MKSKIDKLLHSIYMNASKLKYLILFVFPAVLAVMGCTKLTENPKASLTPETYFKSQADLDAAVAAIFQGQVVDGGYAFDFPMYSYFGGDDLTTDPQLGKGDQLSFDELNGSSGNGSLANSVWATPWAAIYQCNNVTDNYQKVVGDQATKNASAAQAFFVRAWSYFVLVRTFGPVPVITTGEPATYQPGDSSPWCTHRSLRICRQQSPCCPPIAERSSHRVMPPKMRPGHYWPRSICTWVTRLSQPDQQIMHSLQWEDSVIKSGQYAALCRTMDRSSPPMTIRRVSLPYISTSPAETRLPGMGTVQAWDENALDGNFSVGRNSTPRSPILIMPRYAKGPMKRSIRHLR